MRDEDIFDETVIVIDGETNQVIGAVNVGFLDDLTVNPATNLVYGTRRPGVTVIQDEEILPPLKNGTSFTFNCKRDFIEGPVFGIGKLVLALGDNEDCALKLTNFEPGTPVEISTNLRTGLRLSIQVDPVSGITDTNGELEFTITAIGRGIDWVAWALPNERGEVKFNKAAYDTGLAWGMFVKVK